MNTLPRAQLYELLDRYLAALEARHPQRVPWHPAARTTENNVELEAGDGLWGTITGRGGYDLRFADEAAGQVGFFGSVIETRDESPFTVRIAVRDAAIAEVETLVVRAADSGIPFPAPRYDVKPVLNEFLADGELPSREELMAAADGYFSTLERNDGTLHVEFDPQCERVENGVRTTNNPEMKLVPVARFGCAQQFRLGNYRYDDRLRARRYPLVDPQRGLVLAAAFIDHCGRLGRYRLTDGSEVESPVRRPHSFYLLELFRVRERKIQQIEANFITVPYHMPSPWKQ